MFVHEVYRKLTLQYHVQSDEKFSPYIGAGINYSHFYNEEAAGFDYWFNENWGANVEVKRLFLNIDGRLNSGTIRADIEIDPWIFGADVSYRF